MPRNPNNPNAKIQARLQLTLPQRRTRYEAIVTSVALGHSLRDIGKQWGLSAERVSQIIEAGPPGFVGKQSLEFQRRRLQGLEAQLEGARVNKDGRVPVLERKVEDARVRLAEFVEESDEH